MTTKADGLFNIELTHHHIASGDCNVHVVDAGQGPCVVLCHGFPEIWISWRNQIPALVEAGYRVLAFDMRGHGLSDVPEALEAYSVLHTVGDVIAVLDHLKIETCVIVGHDAGTTTAFHAPLMRPERFTGVFALSVPFVPRGPISLLQALQMGSPPDFYINYFQETGPADKEFETDVANTMRRMIYGNSGPYCDMMIANGGALLPNLPDVPEEMDFLPQAEFELYVEAFEKTGFTGALNGYRVFQLNWDLTSPWHGMPLAVPTGYIGGNQDNVLAIPGMREAAQAMGSAQFIEGAGHWVQAEAPEEVNAALLAFLAQV